MKERCCFKRSPRQSSITIATGVDGESDKELPAGGVGDADGRVSGPSFGPKLFIREGYSYRFRLLELSIYENNGSGTRPVPLLMPESHFDRPKSHFDRPESHFDMAPSPILIVPF